MKKFFELGFVMMICGSMLLTSCTALKITPREQGSAIGMAAYLGYSKIADRQNQEFKDKVAEIWTIINCIETYDDLATSIDELTKAFDNCIETANLTPQERTACLVLKKRITDKVTEVLTDTLSSNESATEFLLGVREGVNSMAALD